jgi:hypothetical protein
VLFIALALVTVGYTMVFAALHGNWQFWTYFFPKKPNSQAVSTSNAVVQ